MQTETMEVGHAFCHVLFTINFPGTRGMFVSRILFCPIGGRDRRSTSTHFCSDLLKPSKSGGGAYFVGGAYFGNYGNGCHKKF